VRRRRGTEGTEAGAGLDPAFVAEWGKQYLQAWNSLDADGVAALCTEDVVWNDPGLVQPARGREGVRAFVRATAQAFPDFHVEEAGRPFISAEEPRVLSRYRMTGTMRGAWVHTDLAATGRRIDVPGVDEWTFSGELMSQYETYYDSLDMARQLGILPAAGSAATRILTRLQHLQARLGRRKEAGAGRRA
jgi:steroid delta-isomerase-like uncharacterized protein